MRRRRCLAPWNRPQSTSTRLSPSVSRCLLPVTVPAAPRKVNVGVGGCIDRPFRSLRPSVPGYRGRRAAVWGCGVVLVDPGRCGHPAAGAAPGGRRLVTASMEVEVTRDSDTGATPGDDRAVAPGDDWAAAPWAADADEVVAGLDTDAERGLSSDEAARRLTAHGPNELDAAVSVPTWRKVLAQFRDPLIYLLLVAVVISVVSNGWSS